MPRWLRSVHALNNVSAPARGLSPSTRGRGTTCQLRPQISRLSRVCVARASAQLHPLSLGRRAARELAARAPCRAGCGRSMYWARPLDQREAFLCRRAAVVRRASYGLRESAGFRLFAWHRERATAPAVSREEALRASLLRARQAALVVVGPRTSQGHCIAERPFSVGARPWCDVPPAASENQPAFACLRGTRERATALTVSREKALHASLLRARAVPRCWWLVNVLGKATTLASGLSPSARGRGATCQLQPPRISRLSRVHMTRTSAPLRLLSLGRRRCTRACCACTQCRAGRG